VIDGNLSPRGASSVAMLTQFMRDWHEETRKWIDAVLKTAAAESEHNRNVLQEWINKWMPRATAALKPIVAQALGAEAEQVVAEEVEALKARLKKTGIEI